jgi:DNA ligase-1
MLAHTYNPSKHDVGGWYASEKLDGMRAYWDGGVSRGVDKRLVPWANNAKDERYVDEQVSTGLWSRYGNVIHAPDWWLNQLPRVPLDGELYIPNFRQELMCIVKQLKPDDHDWKQVKYYCFDMPLIIDGKIDIPNFTTKIKGAKGWFEEGGLTYLPKLTNTLQTTYKLLLKHLDGNKVALAHEQVELPFQLAKSRKALEDLVDKVVQAGGEGVIVRKPSSVWLPHRAHTCLKVKPFEDDEGTVVGYTTGRKTDKGSKLLGRMGALVLDYNGKRMELSGFTDAERELTHNAMWQPLPADEAEYWATLHPGEECPDWIVNPNFPRGSKVTFKFRGKTKDGLPQEARYWRKREL